VLFVLAVVVVEEVLVKMLVLAAVVAALVIKIIFQLFQDQVILWLLVQLVNCLLARDQLAEIVIL
jgi:hypothetical protein